jgi:protein-disulfide isomerase
MTPALEKSKAEFKDQVAFAYKDVPLQMHPNAPKAAEAAHCAGSQGKYWEYHDLLWKNKQLEIPALKENARALGIDGKAFDKCLDSGEKAEIIKDHVQEATSMGINGTPVFVINGRYFSGALSYEKLRSIIEEEIGSTSVASQAPAKR